MTITLISLSPPTSSIDIRTSLEARIFVLCLSGLVCVLFPVSYACALLSSFPIEPDTPSLALRRKQLSRFMTLTCRHLRESWYLVSCV